MPPLTALRAFEAAGRLGGFAPAALELGVTPGAVTAHLKTLEAQLGAPLFKRHHRGVTLTALGERALPEFTAAFAALTDAVNRLQADAAPDVIRIATTADLATLWLSPRLPRVRKTGAQVVPVIVSDALAAQGRAEIGVFLDEGGSSACVPSVPPLPLVAVAAPGLIAPGAVPTDLRPEDCLSLYHAGLWHRWDAGIRPGGMVHDQAVLAVEEAANGAGVLVIPLPLVETALKSGRVVEPFGIRVPSDMSLRVEALRDLKDRPLARTVLALLRGD